MTGVFLVNFWQFKLQFKLHLKCASYAWNYLRVSPQAAQFAYCAIYIYICIAICAPYISALFLSVCTKGHATLTKIPSKNYFYQRITFKISSYSWFMTNKRSWRILKWAGAIYTSQTAHVSQFFTKLIKANGNKNISSISNIIIAQWNVERSSRRFIKLLLNQI